MPNTGERREITKRVNANEAQIIQQEKKLVSRTTDATADTNAKNLARRTGDIKLRFSRKTETQPDGVGNSEVENQP